MNNSKVSGDLSTSQNINQNPKTDIFSVDPVLQKCNESFLIVENGLEAILSCLDRKIEEVSLVRQLPGYSVDRLLSQVHFALLRLYRFPFDSGEDARSFDKNPIQNNPWHDEEEPVAPQSDVYAGDSVPLVTRQVPTSKPSLLIM